MAKELSDEIIRMTDLQIHRNIDRALEAEDRDTQAYCWNMVFNLIGEFGLRRGVEKRLKHQMSTEWRHKLFSAIERHEKTINLDTVFLGFNWIKESDCPDLEHIAIVIRATVDMMVEEWRIEQGWDIEHVRLCYHMLDLLLLHKNRWDAETYQGLIKKVLEVPDIPMDILIRLDQYPTRDTSHISNNGRSPKSLNRRRTDKKRERLKRKRDE